MRHFFMVVVIAVGSAARGGSAGAGCVSPVNETCDGLIAFDTNDLPYSTSGLIGCVNNIVDKPYWDIFYRYDCLSTAEHTFSMCDSDGDTYIRIYTGGCGWGDGEEFAVADDECPGSPPNADPLLTVTLEAGTTYWIELGTWRPDAPWGAPNLPFVFNATRESCPGDGDGDGVVGIGDFLTLLGLWGGSDAAYDFDGDGTVGIGDFLIVLGNWGPCP